MSEPKKVEHTKLPWTHDRMGCFVFAEDGQMPVLEVRGWGYLTGNPKRLSSEQAEAVQKANAEFICRACNSHEALLAALKEMRELNAACFRAIAKLDTGRRVGPPAQDVLLYEVRAAGIKDGVGVRAQQAISLAEAGDR